MVEVIDPLEFFSSAATGAGSDGLAAGAPFRRAPDAASGSCSRIRVKAPLT
jgi:hypothetical protein